MKREDGDGDEDRSPKKPKDHPRFTYLQPCGRRQPRIGEEFQATIQPALIGHDHQAETVITEEEKDDNDDASSSEEHAKEDKHIDSKS
jgi:hypothetical protein